MQLERDFYQISLKLILKNKQGETLVLKAVENGSYEGFYDLPGGRINVDEFEIDFLEILKRELREEIGKVTFSADTKPVALGRHLIPAQFSDEKKDKHVLYVFFEGQYIEGEVKISEEHAAFQWLDLDKIELEEYFSSGILEGIKMYLKLV